MEESELDWEAPELEDEEELPLLPESAILQEANREPIASSVNNLNTLLLVATIKHLSINCEDKYKSFFA